ncbi:MAG: NAD-dependent epimerase/dehydratase family protein [Myxococcota bacterium]
MAGTRTAIVTGASGFIGSWVRNALEGEGFQVRALRRRRSPRASSAFEVDYEAPDTVFAAFEEARPEVVVHLAGTTKGVTLRDFRRANVVPTEAVVQAAEQVGVRRFVSISSLVAFGPSSPETPHRDGVDAQPVEFYGRTKREAEMRVEASGLPYVILRPGGVYGPGDIDYFNLFKSADRGYNLFFGNRERLFSKIYIDDMVGFVLAALKTPQTRTGWFVCDGEPVSWGEFQGEIARQSGRRVRELHLPEFMVGVAARAGEALSTLDRKPRLFNRQKAIMGRQAAWTCDSSNAVNSLAYVPKVKLSEGVRRSFAWYREHGWLPKHP